MEPNEGIVTADAKILVKSEMVRSLRDLGRTTPDAWERKVFSNLTGQQRDDVDWDVEDNHAGYFLWIKSFDQLVDELVDDGYARTVQENEHMYVEATEDPDGIGVSTMVYPDRA